MTTDSKPTAKTENVKKEGELSEEQLNDVSGGPIYMVNTSTLVPAVQPSPTMPIGNITGGARGG
jgi:hypothetical protein